MTKRSHYFILLFLSLSAAISSAQPVNDFQCNPKFIGVLPNAPVCSPTNPSNNFGSFITLNAQSTAGAATDSLSGAITECYSGSAGPNDVWFVFIASESHAEVVIQSTGTAPLKDLYVGIYEVLGNDCIGLIPRNCYSSSGLALDTIEFSALAAGVKYYLQVASTAANGAGSFNISVRSKNICSECMRTSVLQAFPAPARAAYPPDTTVGFCYSVVGYNEQYGNRLHGIAPLLGSGWDSPTMIPIVLPASADGQGQWHWYSNLIINGAISETGFFYDVGGDNDPRNNLGDRTGGQPHVWNFCFTVKTQTKALCDGGLNDLSIQFINYSDGESGSFITTQNCSGDENYKFNAHMNCCERPQFVSVVPASCNSTNNGAVTALGGGSSSGYGYDLYSSNGMLLNSQSSFTNYSFNGLYTGNYYLNIKNNSGSCMTSVGFKVEGPIGYNLFQTVFGCGGSCSNQAKFILNRGSVPQSITWSNGDTGPSTSSGLCGGWRKVTIVDSTGTCTIIDSVFITPQTPPLTAFQYDKTYYCSSDSFAFLTDFPGTGGGVFSLAFSSAGGIIPSDVNSSNGRVNLLNISASGFAIIKYQSGPPCNAVSTDTIYYSPSPGPVNLPDYTDKKICYGNPDPLFLNAQSMYKITWYDEFGNNLGDQLPGTTFDPYFGAAPSPGGYFFYVTQSDTASFSCQSVPKQIKIDVYDPPVVFAGDDAAACPGFGVILHASGADSYIWGPAAYIDNTSSAAPTASPVFTTLFYVTGTSTFSGCSGSDSVLVYVDSLSNCALIIYSGFTPNGDGHNDFWFIDGISSDINNKAAIFNRWGEKVWETTNYDNQSKRWEGQDFAGEILPDGTYFYLINYKAEVFKGWVELTR